MSSAHVFVETNFLFGIFRMPSNHDPKALLLRARFTAGEVKLFVPYLCFQEARNVIAKSLPRNRCADLQSFHRFAVANKVAAWNSAEIQKLLDAASAEVSRTKALYSRELAAFAAAVGDGILHGTKEVFDLLESLELDDDTLKYNDRLILSSVLCKARQLKASGADRLFFASLDTGDLQPTSHRPRLSRYYDEAGVVFVPNFVLPDPPMHDGAAE